MRYTALGDSITAGSGASRPDRAYPARILEASARTRSPAARRPGLADCLAVLAEPGWTTAALDAAVLEQDPLWLTRADAISVWIGGDDLAAAGLALLRVPRSAIGQAAPRLIEAAIASHRRHLAHLLRHLRQTSRARLVVCTQYNPFPNSPLAAMAIAQLNQATRSVAAEFGAALAPADTWFAGREALLIRGYRTGRLEDVLTDPVLPVHPNDEGHRVIARHLGPILGIQ
ncbi:SGNH/GDSL hydrolase family protein [Alicyclobacillus sp.]|uniref:SGNH/GDSL hydrolase family protein n=1 Tax=Alicyclobacillus sp. TaxID=61169 RepID=UPI0025C0B81C|nr:SGNH/GDSL hydrolase family protein [Alicyclobacillus sp.]MCL6515690.1 SGNH/GDSL hydrolase family protein [Alicyclobacillus sp.]